jgi:hypothetical protein
MSDENLQKHDLPAAPRTTAFTILIRFWGLCGERKEGKMDAMSKPGKDIESSKSRVAIITIKSKTTARPRSQRHPLRPSRSSEAHAFGPSRVATIQISFKIYVLYK